METEQNSPNPTSPEVQAELARRNKSAATTVVGLLVASILLSVVAFLSRPYLIEKPNPPLDAAVKILMLLLGIGVVIWRRTKLAAARLQDIFGVAGVSGLLKTLEKTTIQMALLASAITGVGFISTLVTGNDWYTYQSSAIAIILFIYTYPLKNTWNQFVQRYLRRTEPEPVDPTPVGP